MNIRTTILFLVGGAMLAISGMALAGSNSMDHGNMGQGAMMGTPMVGGSAMYANKNIVQNALNSEAHTTLVAAVKAAGLVGALQGEGPYTVFAPTNDAFEDLPDGTVSTLMKPENKAKLKSVLLYHVVPGRVTYSDMFTRLTASDSGKITLKTLAGGTLTVRRNGNRNIVIVDDHGNVAHISTYNVQQSNGVIHVIDHVLLP